MIIKWIPYNKRKPKGDAIECLFKVKNQIGTYIGLWWENSDRINVNRAGCHDQTFLKSDIIKWMPVPK